MERQMYLVTAPISDKGTEEDRGQQRATEIKDKISRQDF